MEGFNDLELDSLCLMDFHEVVNDLSSLGFSDGDGSGLAIKEPAQDLFGCGPDAIQEELLVGDGVLHGAASEMGRGEDVMDGMEKGSTDM